MNSRDIISGQGELEDRLYSANITNSVKPDLLENPERRKLLKYLVYGSLLAVGVGGSIAYYLWTRSKQNPPSLGTTTTPTLLPLKVEYKPNSTSTLEELVFMKDQLFDPWAGVSGGVEPITAKWYLNNEDTISFSTKIDPDPIDIKPGTFYPRLTVTDGAQQKVDVNLPKIVKTGDFYQLKCKFGVSDPLYLGGGGKYSSMAEIKKAISMIHETGIQTIRLEFNWPLIEPFPGNYYFDMYDAIVGEIRKSDIDILPYMSVIPQWASSEPNKPEHWTYPPKDPKKYGEFIFTLASHYKDSIHAWQICNEPNFDLYFKGVDPVKYVQMLKEAYLAVKYADPKSIVVMAGLAEDVSKWFPGVPNIIPEDFLRSIYRNGGGRYFDVLARHPYTDPHEGVNALVNKIKRVRSVMIDNGDKDKDIWVTENSWPTIRTSDYSFSEEQQASWLKESFDAMLRLDYMKKVFWHTFRDMGTDPANPEDNYGLVKHDWTPKKTLEAYREYIRMHK